uniref:RNA-directed DNA polymerase n=1 Tax=Phlebotomus papatasi TaxID=29031 RepID=A0A1B0DKQ2_PHLPP
RVQLQCKIRKKVIPLWFQVIGGDRNCIIDGKSAVKAGLIAKINEVAVDEKVFSGLGQLKNFEYDAELIENPTFVIHPARNVPYRLKEDVKKEIDQMVEMGVVEPCTEATDAVSPMVVVKRKGKLRICADLTDVNSNIKRRHYPLTGIDQVAANVSGSRHFTILDCKKGFWQIPLSKKTSRLCTFATPWGRFSYRRLPFGLVSAPELFQRMSTQEDPVLNKLIKFIMKGWPETSDEVPKSIRNYFTFREELSFTEGLIFKGDKVVVPETERKGALKNIHAGHIGVQASLRRARDFLYWPGMNSEITDMIGKCLICERNQRTNQKETLMMKRIPEYPFEIIATDLFTFKKQEYILMVDSYSGYFDFKCLKKTGSSAVIKFLKDKFADHGIPQEVHSDGGPQFASKEFKKFAKEWKFDHVQSSPYFARSNGLAERYVQTAKKLLKKCREDGQDVKLALLLSRNTPGDGLKSPAERLFSRKTRNPLCVNRNLLMPKVVEDNSKKLQEKREQQKKYGDIGAKDFEELPEGERVRVQERDKSWSTGTIKQQKSGRSYIVAMDDGRIIWRNRHFLQRSKLEESLLASETQSPVHEPIETSSDRAIVDVTPSDPLPKPVNDTPVQLAESSSSAGIQSPARAPVITTRSGRVVKPPDRLNL